MRFKLFGIFFFKPDKRNLPETAKPERNFIRFQMPLVEIEQKSGFDAMAKRRILFISTYQTYSYLSHNQINIIYE